MKMKTVVSAEIGGVNTRFLLTELLMATATNTTPLHHSYESKVIFSQSYRNEEYNTFSVLFKQFLMKDAKINSSNLPLSACIAANGPVMDNKIDLTTHVSWSIDGELIAQEFQIPHVEIINNFLAVGYGLLTLKEETECICVQPNEKILTAPMVCIGPGTGFGECFLTPDHGNYQCFQSHGGHAEFAPRSELQTELLQFLKHKHEQKHRISVDRIVSARGLTNIYEFLSSTFPEKIDPHVHKIILEAGDMKSALIAVLAASSSNSLCGQAKEIFLSAYGAEAGVAALKWMPFGGLYLTGGLTPENVSSIRDPDGPFLESFFDKGRVSEFLKLIPMYAVLVDDLGERGAQYYAIELIHMKSIEVLEAVSIPTSSFGSLLASDNLLSLAMIAFAGAAVGFALAKIF